MKKISTLLGSVILLGYHAYAQTSWSVIKANAAFIVADTNYLLPSTGIYFLKIFNNNQEFASKKIIVTE